MEKRTFLKTGFFLGIAAATTSFLDACKSTATGGASDAAAPVIPPPKLRRTTPFELPKLAYETSALEPHIDKMTMEIHHDRHHQGYVNNLNDAVKNTVYADYELYDIISRIGTGDADKKIRNNAGGHWNHTFFWETLSPGGGGAPSGQLASAIDAQFGSYDKFKEQFSTAAKSVFGSGWAWLCVGKDKGLFITTTPNQDNPLMLSVVKQNGTPIIGIDVWEHAYYLKYQNKRPDYITAFYNVVNWKEAAMRYEKAMFG
ncbi:MAG: superoxide dismutase [Lewinellaceae bacterium]|jgi:Fe-Mn family superoxide dismutase|nr:superoxide dismutase [Lewinellaceae bacterium]